VQRSYRLRAYWGCARCSWPPTVLHPALRLGPVAQPARPHALPRRDVRAGRGRHAGLPCACGSHRHRRGGRRSAYRRAGTQAPWGAWSGERRRRADGLAGVLRGLGTRGCRCSGSARGRSREHRLPSSPMARSWRCGQRG